MGSGSGSGGGGSGSFGPIGGISGPGGCGTGSSGFGGTCPGPSGSGVPGIDPNAAESKSRKGMCVVLRFARREWNRVKALTGKTNRR